MPSSANRSAIGISFVLREMTKRVLTGMTEESIDRAVNALFDVRQTHVGDFTDT